MHPLSERSSKSCAKATVLLLWLASAALAAPMPFFFEYTEVFDDLNGGTKPFCAVVPTIGGGGNGNSSADYYYADEAVNASSLEDDVRATPGGGGRALTTFQIYNCLLTLFQYLLPLVVISYAYLRMCKRLWLTQTPGAAQQKRDRMILVNKKKTIKMLIIVVILFGLCWLPWHLFHTLTLLFPVLNTFHYINIVFFVTHWLAMSNSCYNPFIYAIYSEKFKREFRECAYCRRCQNGQRCFFGAGGGGADDSPRMMARNTLHKHQANSVAGHSTTNHQHRTLVHLRSMPASVANGKKLSTEQTRGESEAEVVMPRPRFDTQQSNISGITVTTRLHSESSFTNGGGSGGGWSRHRKLTAMSGDSLMMEMEEEEEEDVVEDQLEEEQDRYREQDV